jgi:hypothetical protein
VNTSRSRCTERQGRFPTLRSLWVLIVGLLVLVGGTQAGAASLQVRGSMPVVQSCDVQVSDEDKDCYMPPMPPESPDDVNATGFIEDSPETQLRSRTLASSRSISPASEKAGFVRVSWSRVPDPLGGKVVGYHVFMSADKSGKGASRVADVRTGTSVKVTGLAPSTRYYFAVRAYTRSLSSAYSDWVDAKIPDVEAPSPKPSPTATPSPSPSPTATPSPTASPSPSPSPSSSPEPTPEPTPEQAPGSSSDIRAVASGSGDSGTVRVSWSPVPDPVGGKVVGYHVYRSTDSTGKGGVKIADVTSGTATTVTGLAAGTQYYFAVRAYTKTLVGASSDWTGAMIPDADLPSPSPSASPTATPSPSPSPTASPSPSPSPSPTSTPTPTASPTPTPSPTQDSPAGED